MPINWKIARNTYNKTALIATLHYTCEHRALVSCKTSGNNRNPLLNISIRLFHSFPINSHTHIRMRTLEPITNKQITIKKARQLRRTTRTACVYIPCIDTDHASRLIVPRAHTYPWKKRDTTDYVRRRARREREISNKKIESDSVWHCRGDDRGTGAFDRPFSAGRIQACPACRHVRTLLYIARGAKVIVRRDMCATVLSKNKWDVRLGSWSVGRK